MISIPSHPTSNCRTGAAKSTEIAHAMVQPSDVPSPSARILAFAIVVMLAWGSTHSSITQAQERATFEFTYSAAINLAPLRTRLDAKNSSVERPETADQGLRVWLPIAESNPHQTVEIIGWHLPLKTTFSRDPEYGNRIAYFEMSREELQRWPDDRLPFEITYHAVRTEVVLGDNADGADPKLLQLALQPNRLVPLVGKHLNLIRDLDISKQKLEASRQFYDVVLDYMNYDKSKPGYGNGDVEWACDSRTGNCTDFHSVFMALARANRIPSIFEIGFPIPQSQPEGTVGGYHCWAWFYDATKGWVAVDISEADKHPEKRDDFFGHLPPDRIAFTRGRDIRLVPEAAESRLNYFIYPHVEFAGKKVDKDLIDLRFSYRRNLRSRL